MRAFTKKQSKEQTSSNRTRYNTITPGPDHHIDTILPLQRASATVSSRFGQDFSRQTGAPPLANEVVCSSGQPLDAATRGFMESRFGHDFSHVRVHMDAAAANAAAHCNARAFTLNHHIHFGSSYKPSSPAGEALLVHELTHIVQADTAASNPAQPATSVEALEFEARGVAASFRGGGAMPPVLGLARDLTVPLRDDASKPTFGNLPQDDPLPVGRRRVELVKGRDGKWSAMVPGSDVGKGLRRTAKGSYSFVVQNGRIWAVKPGSNNLGHTEAALGGRVTWAGTITFNDQGQLTKWTNASGHHLPAGSFIDEKTVKYVHPDLDYNHYRQTYSGSVVRPDTGKREGPQLPVYQPKKGETLIPRGRGGDIKRLGAERQPVPQKTIISGEFTSADKLAPPAPSPAVPKKGSQAVGRVTVEYDFTGSEAKGSVTLKEIDLSNYPPDGESGLTRFFKDRPVLRQFSSMAAHAAASYISGKALEKVQSHFESAMEQARVNFEKEFPAVDMLLRETGFREKEQTFNKVMDWLEEHTIVAIMTGGKTLEEMEKNLDKAFVFENTLDTIQAQLPNGSELFEISTDIQKRADTLLQIAQGLEQAFGWIHTHLIGSIPLVYYESFTLWSVRGTFDGLGRKMSSLAGTISSRESEYHQLLEILSKRLIEVEGRLEFYREFYEKNAHLLQTK